MPLAPPTRCRCGRIATHRGRCDHHQPKPWATPSKRNQVLDKWKWRKVSTAHRRRHPRCAQCGALATQTDHIVSIADDGALYDDANLQSLCDPCHDKKNRAERARAQRRRRQAKRQG